MGCGSVDFSSCSARFFSSVTVLSRSCGVSVLTEAPGNAYALFGADNREKALKVPWLFKIEA